MQTVSDVPVGLFLSGGVDSSSIAGILSRAGIKLNTFSLVFREMEYSEAEHSRAVASAFATDHQEIMVSQGDMLDAIPYALQAMDEPMIDGLNTYLISRQTRAAGIKVALSGLGGTSCSPATQLFRRSRMERFAKFSGILPAPLRQPAARMLASLAADTDRNRKIAALAGRRDEVIHPYFLARTLFTADQRDALLAEVEDSAMDRAMAPLQESFRQTRALDAINRVSYLEARCYMLNTLLRDSDVMSMAHGLELRVPYRSRAGREVAGHARLLEVRWRCAEVPAGRALKGALPDSISCVARSGASLCLLNIGCGRICVPTSKPPSNGLGTAAWRSAASGLHDLDVFLNSQRPVARVVPVCWSVGAS